MLRTSLAACAMFMACAPAIGEEANLLPGEWTYTLSFEGNGVSNSNSNTDCMSAEEARMDTSRMVAGFAGGADCTSSVVNQEPGSITFDMTCPSSEAIRTARLTMAYQPTKFTITGPVTVNVGDGRTVDLSFETKARYLGACPD